MVKTELANLRNGFACAPFSALVRCIQRLPAELLASNPRLLDVGAASGYYSEILRLAGFTFDYTGLDFSTTFKELAETLYPGIAFDVGDARALPYADHSFDAVLTSAVIMHVLEYPQIIKEVARVAKQFVIFNRTPVSVNKATSFWVKEAYGVPVLELAFNESELRGLFKDCGLTLMHSETVFWAHDSGHRTYLLMRTT